MPEIIQDSDFFKVLVNNSASVFQVIDTNFIFTFSTNSVINILGFSPEEILGKNAIDFVHPDEKKLVSDWLSEVQENTGNLLTLEHRIKNKQGEYIWIENNAAMMPGNGNINSIVMNFKDIQAKKIADHALLQAEQRLSLLLNNTEESFIILNSRLRIVTYNKAAQDYSPFFYNSELQSGISVLDLINKTEINDYISLFEEVFKGKQQQRESVFSDAGSEHIFNHTFRPLFDDQNDIFGVFITSTEITERKKLNEEAVINSERLKTAQNIARLGYFEYDITSREIFGSKRFYEILEINDHFDNWRQLYDVEEMIYEDDRDVLKCEIRKLVTQGKDFSLEFRLNSKQGNQKVILAMGGGEKNTTGKVIKFRVTLQDITDSKIAVLAIQTLEKKFKSLFENSIDGILLSNESGDIISANPALCELLGYTPEEITFIKCDDLTDPDSFLCKEMNRMLKDTGVYMGELLFRHKNGSFIPAEVTSVAMKDGEPYFSTIIRDSTQKKKTESEQKALTEELLKNNQDLQQFSFITSHNLRAPVANQLSLLSLYDKENPGDDFNSVLIQKFEETTFQLNQTLNDLINVLVIKSQNNIEKETVSFTQIFNTIKKNLGNLLNRKKGTIHTDFSAVDEIQYNRIHAESVFLNMISNAIKYSSPERKLEIKIRSYKLDTFVVVDFADNGLGMDLNRYGDRLFGLYQRFHQNKDGKGLGLYMTRSQVLAMGGKIEVESELGKGTTFKIFFKI